MICHGWVAIPHKEMVILPDGTGGLADSCAVPAGTEQAMAASTPAEVRKRSNRNFMIGGWLINLVWLVVGDERCTSQGFNLKIDSGIKKGTMGRILSASPTIAAPLSRAQDHRSRNAERFPPGFRSRCDRQGVPRF